MNPETGNTFLEQIKVLMAQEMKHQSELVIAQMKEVHGVIRQEVQSLQGSLQQVASELNEIKISNQCVEKRLGACEENGERVMKMMVGLQKENEVCQQNIEYLKNTQVAQEENCAVMKQELSCDIRLVREDTAKINNAFARRVTEVENEVHQLKQDVHKSKVGESKKTKKRKAVNRRKCISVHSSESDNETNSECTSGIESEKEGLSDVNNGKNATRMPKISELKHFTTYSGLYDKISPKTFLIQFEQEALLSGVSEQTYVRILSFVLKESAKGWYECNKSKFSSYQKFKELFLQQFLNESIVASRVAALRAQRFDPKSYRTVMEFVLDKYNKMKQLETDVNDLRLICEIRESLPFRYKGALLGINFNTFDEFMGAVQQIEMTPFSSSTNQQNRDSSKQANIRNVRYRRSNNYRNYSDGEGQGSSNSRQMNNRGRYQHNRSRSWSRHEIGNNNDWRNRRRQQEHEADERNQNLNSRPPFNGRRQETPQQEERRHLQSEN